MKFYSDPFLSALEQGYFPMGDHRDSGHVYFLNPTERAVFLPQDFHAPRRLRRFMRREPYGIYWDRDFAGVMEACREAVSGREESWINPPILEAYQELHERGHAHSVECWHEGRLVGGLYGVKLGAAFFGESMFSHARDASKIALVYLMARLVAGGFHFLDAQFHTPHLEQFGASALPQREFLRYLEKAKGARASYHALEEDVSPSRALQLTGQTL